MYQKCQYGQDIDVRQRSHQDDRNYSFSQNAQWQHLYNDYRQNYYDPYISQWRGSTGFPSQNYRTHSFHQNLPIGQQSQPGCRGNFDGQCQHLYNNYRQNYYDPYISQWRGSTGFPPQNYRTHNFDQNLPIGQQSQPGCRGSFDGQCQHLYNDYRQNYYAPCTSQWCGSSQFSPQNYPTQNFDLPVGQRSHQDDRSFSQNEQRQHLNNVSESGMQDYREHNQLSNPIEQFPYQKNGAYGLDQKQMTLGNSCQGQNMCVGDSATLNSVEYQLPSVNPVSTSQPCETEVSTSCESENDNNEGNCRLVNYLYYLYEKPKENDQNVAVTFNTTDDIQSVVDEHRVSSSEETISVNIKPKHKFGCDNSDMYVNTSDQAAKKLCCPFCDKLFSKLPRHMEVKHKQEPDVQNFLKLPKGSKQRRIIQDSLRKIGTFNFNKSAKLNKRQLITSRRPNLKHKRTAVDHTSCPYCLGSYAKSGLPYHIKNKCPQKPIEDERTEGERVTSSLSASVEGRYREDTSPALQKIFNKFRNNSVVRGIKFDWLFVVYGNKLTVKFPKPRSGKMIANKLRLIARVLSALKKIEPNVTELAKLFLPEYYDRVLDAIRAVARVDEARNEFVAPATASSAVTAIRQIGQMLLFEYTKKRDKESQDITREFLEIANFDMFISINKMAIETQSRKARQKKVILPSTDDVKRLAQYIEAQRIQCYNELYDSNNKLIYKKWKRLTELTMASIIVFNRRRVGDTENILDEDFEHKEVIDDSTNQELLSTMPQHSREIATQYSRMKVRGKRNRTVPVLLKADVVSCLKVIIAHRQDAGIPPINNFLFAMPSKTDDFNVVNAGRVLRNFAIASGAKDPTALTATNLRKHLATKCVTMQLNDSSVADVASFMGHAEKVHREYYRQNTLDRQIVQMSQVLEAAQGNISIADQNDVNPMDNNKSRKRKMPIENCLGKRKSRRVSKKKKE